MALTWIKTLIHKIIKESDLTKLWKVNICDVIIVAIDCNQNWIL